MIILHKKTLSVVVLETLDVVENSRAADGGKAVVDVLLFQLIVPQRSAAKVRRNLSYVCWFEGPNEMLLVYAGVVESSSLEMHRVGNSLLRAAQT